MIRRLKRLAKLNALRRPVRRVAGSSMSISLSTPAAGNVLILSVGARRVRTVSQRGVRWTKQRDTWRGTPIGAVGIEERITFTEGATR